MIIPIILSVALIADASPSARTCEPGDNACKAELFVKRAKKAPTAEQRAKYLHAAHRSYLYLYDETHEARDLCAARRTVDQGLAITGLSDVLRADFEAARDALMSREREAGVRCGRTSKPPKTDPPLLAAKRLPNDPPVDAPATPNLTTTDSPSASTPAPVALQSTVRQGELANSDGSTVRPEQPASGDGLRPVTRSSSARPTTARPGRGLAIAGGAGLGVGLVLTGVAGYLGGRMVDTVHAAREFKSQIDGFASDAEIARDAELKQDYRRLGPPTLALALAGGTTLVVSAVLLGVGGRRMARASRMALMPTPGGLAFGARF
ncbi:hypothetical protein OV203_33700 [Nannocystis sp. ILAH1]|uniref:hypothetical protein n=1 Tax=Nannocystis sp. ILAH1 TaxID=2996789 RepID=UPI002270C4E4|nr:hypothetical protein [Nannocystis sp. ILAH1]MCY0992141.1 hypothetical protein [Nannocystis sp. ILAH1]